jgi:hypothetical protein
LVLVLIVLWLTEKLGVDARNSSDTGTLLRLAFLDDGLIYFTLIPQLGTALSTNATPVNKNMHISNTCGTMRVELLEHRSTYGLGVGVLGHHGALRRSPMPFVGLGCFVLTAVSVPMSCEVQ